VKLRRGLLGFIAVFQSVLFLAHYLLYQTWTFAAPGTDSLWLKLSFFVLSVIFLSASLLAFRWNNAVVRTFYRIGAVWLGLLTYLFIAAIFSWIVLAIAFLGGLALNFHLLVELSFGSAILAGLYGVFNAQCTRITRITVRLANLPERWRGRKAALISDVHLGHVRHAGFSAAW